MVISNSYVTVYQRVKDEFLPNQPIDLETGPRRALRAPWPGGSRWPSALRIPNSGARPPVETAAGEVA